MIRGRKRGLSPEGVMVTQNMKEAEVLKDLFFSSFKCSSHAAEVIDSKGGTGRIINCPCSKLGLKPSEEPEGA